MLVEGLTEEQSFDIHGGDKRAASLTPYILGYAYQVSVYPSLGG